MADLTAIELRKLLDYDPATGVFRWRNDGRIAGSIVGGPRGGYLQIVIRQEKWHKAHRLAWLYVHGDWPERELDHRNRIKTDNRIDNLRLATRVENMRNYPVPRNNTSGVKGVSFCKAKGRYKAYVNFDGKQRYLGLFASLEAAATVAVAARQNLFGQFADAA